jgi:outer membrane receptor protein involved in Fe transport
VRNDITEANPGLDPERLLGGEIGADYARSALLGRLTGFWNEVTDPIANVTIGNGPGVVAPCGFVPEGGVCRQRQNLDRTRIRGIEAEIDVIPSPSWTGTASYLFDEAAVRSAPNQRDLEGKRIAQVPEHQVVLRLAYANPAIVDANVQVRWVGDQFEDDLNALVLGDFAVVDLFVGRAIHPGWDVFVSVENLFDRTYEAGKTADGIVTIGSPVLVHGGLRVRF